MDYYVCINFVLSGFNHSNICIRDNSYVNSYRNLSGMSKESFIFCVVLKACGIDDLFFNSKEQTGYYQRTISNFFKYYIVDKTSSHSACKVIVGLD